MHDIGQDLRFALRQLRRSPGFTFFIAATLAVGIGANTTMFSAAYALLLRPLPWDGADRMVRLFGAYEGRGSEWSVSLPNADDWRTRSTAFDDVAWYQGTSVTAAGDGAPERIIGLRGSANLLGLLGARPLLGRTFTMDEAHPDAERVVVLSHAIWQRRYGGDADVIGRTVELNGLVHSIIGVLPPDFAFPTAQTELYLPLRATPTTWNRANGGLQVLARMRTGVTLDQAQRDLDGLSAQLAAEHPETNGTLSAAIRPLRDVLHGGADTRLVMLLLLGGTAFVLLIACVNAANLLLSRATAREREIAVRSAMGAGRSRVLRQLITESLVLAAVGGIAGALLAVWGTSLLALAIPASSSLPREFRVDAVALGFTAALVLGTGLLFGVAPALQASRPRLAGLLGARGGAQTVRRTRRRNALVVAEVALASVLLVSAGLMLRSIDGLLRTEPGFDADGLVTARVSLDAGYSTADQVLAFQRRVLDEVRAMPGITNAGIVDFAPLAGTNNFNDFFLEGGVDAQNAGSLIAAPGYIEAMGIPLLRGRTIDDRDVRDAGGVVVVSRSMAERYWPGEDAIGKRIVLSWERGERPYWRTVVGIVGDVRHGGLDNDPRAEFYIPFGQLTWASGSMTFVVRGVADAASVATAMRAAVDRVDPKQAVYDVRTMSRIVRETGAVVTARIIAGGLVIFGVVALLLAALGLYGVMSYNVAQRTGELGVRAALGASRTDVLGLVLRQGMRLVAIGLTIGLAGALAITRIMRGLLYGVTPWDPAAFVLTAVVLSLVAAIAALLPAMRAAGIDPLEAMRTAQ